MVTNPQTPSKGATMLLTNFVFISIISFYLSFLVLAQGGLFGLIAIQFRAELGTILMRRFEQRPHFG
jgi:hypothetical protein